MKTKNGTSKTRCALLAGARWNWIVGCASAVCAAMAAAQPTSILNNPSFESGMSGWTASGNVATRSSAPYQAADGTGLIAFNAGDTTATGKLNQTFDTVAGRDYTISFAMGVLSYVRGTQSLGVEVIGRKTIISRTFSISPTGNIPIRWGTQSLTFTADSARTTLSFRDRSVTTRSIDLLLDRVSVTPPPLYALSVDVTPVAAELVIAPPDESGASNGNAGLGFGSLSRLYSQGTSATVTVPELLWSASYPEDALVYRFIGWTLDGNPAGNGLSIRVTMTGHRSLMAGYAPSPPIITRQPEDLVLPYGGTATFIVEAIGSSDMNYEWQFTQRLPFGPPGPSTFQNGPSNTTVLTGVGSDYDGVYEVIVSNAAGSTRSRKVTLLTVGDWILNSEFESGFQNVVGSLAGWRVEGNVRTQATSNNPQNGFVAAFNAGNSNPNGSIEQPVATTPGTSYMLSFDLGALSYKTAVQHMGVTVRGVSTVADQVISISGGAKGLTNWERRSVFFTADSEVSYIRFTDRSTVTNAIDLLLDNVDIEQSRQGHLLNPSGRLSYGELPSPYRKKPRSSSLDACPVSTFNRSRAVFR